MAPTPSNSKSNCINCRRAISGRDFLKCSACKNVYDIECANISEKLFLSMTPVRRSAFKCRPCVDVCLMPAYTACPSRQGSASQSATTERKANVSPHATRSRNRPIQVPVTSAPAPVTVTSTTIAVAATATATPAPITHAEGYVTEGRLIEILKQELGTTIKEQVSSQLSIIKEQMTSFHDSFTYFNAQFEEMRNRIEEKDSVIQQLKADNAQLHSTVDALSFRLGSVEQQMRENNIEINGIPEHNTENLVNTVINLTKTVDCVISEDDIVHTTRVAKINKDNNKPRAVIVKLRSPRQRDTILAAVSTHNKKNNKDKLSSHHLGIRGNSSPVFVSEHLSPANKHLHAAARQLAKELSYKFVWVRNGRIFMRKDEYSQATLVKSFDYLEQLKTQASLPV